MTVNLARSGRWPKTKQPGDLAYGTVNGQQIRIDRYGNVYKDGYIIAKAPVLVEDTRDYLETITGGA